MVASIWHGHQVTWKTPVTVTSFCLCPASTEFFLQVLPLLGFSLYGCCFAAVESPTSMSWCWMSHNMDVISLNTSMIKYTQLFHHWCLAQKCKRSWKSEQQFISRFYCCWPATFVQISGPWIFILRSLKNKFPVNKQFNSSNQPDCFCITENWLTPSDSACAIRNITPDDHNLQQKPHKNKRGGGLGTLIKNSITQDFVKLP